MAGFTSTFLLASAIVGGGVSVGRSIAAGRAEDRAGRAGRDAAEDQARLLELNAQTADEQAADAIARGHDEAARFLQGLRLLIGSQRAGFAAGNVDVNQGSALDVQRDAEFLGELDRLQIEANAEREARGFRTEAADLRARAGIARRTGVYQELAGRSARAQRYAGAFETVLGTTTSLVQARYGAGRASRSAPKRPIGSFYSDGSGGEK